MIFSRCNISDQYYAEKNQKKWKYTQQTALSLRRETIWGNDVT